MNLFHYNRASLNLDTESVAKLEHNRVSLIKHVQVTFYLTGTKKHILHSFFLHFDLNVKKFTVFFVFMAVSLNCHYSNKVFFYFIKTTIN